MTGYLVCEKSVSVMVKQSSSGYKEQVAQNRIYIGTLIDIILFLGKQGIAYRGHREDAGSLNLCTYSIYYYY